MGAVYPLQQWRRETLAWLKEQGLLQPNEMYSANLYEVDILQTFLAQADTQNFRYEALLGRIITIELALRAVDGIFKYETG